jgi:hypothetical protein
MQLLLLRVVAVLRSSGRNIWFVNALAFFTFCSFTFVEERGVVEEGKVNAGVWKGWCVLSPIVTRVKGGARI